MKVEAECAACLLSRGCAETYMATTNPALRFRCMAELVKLVNKEFKPTSNAAELGTKRDKIIRELTGNRDPYQRTKKQSNQKAKELLPYAQRFVDEGYSQQDRFKKACLCAIVGNIMEFDIPGHNFTCAKPSNTPPKTSSSTTSTKPTNWQRKPAKSSIWQTTQAKLFSTQFL